MNLSDKVINEQGNVSTYCAGADARLRYVDVDGQDKKYLIEGEGGGGSSTVSGLTNEFGTYIKSQTNNAKQLSNIVIDPCKPTNGNAMNLFIKANGNEVISIQNNNINTSFISVGRYNNNVSPVGAQIYLKISDLHIQYLDQSYIDTISIVNNEILPGEYDDINEDMNFIKNTKVEGIFNQFASDEDEDCKINFKEGAYLSKNDYNEVLYNKTFDLTDGISKGIRLKFYSSGSSLDDNNRLGLMCIPIVRLQDSEGNIIWKEDENQNPMFNAWLDSSGGGHFSFLQ